MLKIGKVFTKLPKYQGTGCTACMKCQEKCPTKAIVIKQEDSPKPIFDYTLCSSSFECKNVCPEEVIHARKLKYLDIISLFSLTLLLLIAATVFAFV